MLTRRDLLRSATAGAAALAVPALPSFLRAADPPGFTLPKLPYAFDGKLEPLHRRQDDGDPPRQAPRGVRQKPERCARLAAGVALRS